MSRWPLTLRVTLAIFCLVTLPVTGYAVPVQPVSGASPEQILSDPTPLYVWNVPLNVVLISSFSVIVPTTLFILIQILFSSSLWLHLGHKRVLKKNVLDNETRQRIYSCVWENPGIYLSALSSRLGLNIGTIRYHLGVLCEMGKVVPDHDCGFVRYRVNREKYSELEKKVGGYLCNRSKQRILTLILQNPGITREKIASKLKLSGSGVAWHMGTLILEGIVVSERNGKCVNYFLSSDVKDHMQAPDLFEYTAKIA
ncbi:Winged helix-turn-helix DNA-binding protein [anaerobic digester metagenome]